MAGIIPAWGDRIAGLVLIALGMTVLVNGWHYGIGTLRDLGAGFVPATLGAILGGLGAFIMLGSSAEDGHRIGELSGLPDMRGAACIVLAMVGFLVLAAYAGLLPAAFGCVFIAMLGDRRSTLVEAGIAATVVSVCGSMLFVYVLQIPLPLLR